MQKPAIVRSHRREEKVGRAASRGVVVRAIEHLSRLGEGGNDQPVPVGEDLVVFRRMDALLARGEELSPSCLEPLLDFGLRQLPVARDLRGRLRDVKNVRVDVTFAAVEVPSLLYAIRGDEEVCVAAEQ